jgi:hypothetical protein
MMLYIDPSSVDMSKAVKDYHPSKTNGLTRDPNPNPIGLGLLAGLTFWPAVILIVIGVVRRPRPATPDRGPPRLDR